MGNGEREGKGLEWGGRGRVKSWTEGLRVGKGGGLGVGNGKAERLRVRK